MSGKISLYHRKTKNFLYWLVADEKIRIVKKTRRGSVVYSTNSKTLRRKLWIYVPAHYRQGSPENRTAYMLDGQNMFDIGTGAYGTWSLENELDACHDRKTVVVGIQHGIERKHDYSLADNADNTIAGIVKSILPFIEENFTGPQTSGQRIIGGSSLGANAAIAAIPENSFLHAMLFSTAVEVDYPEHLEYIRNIPENKTRIYMDIGTREATCQRLKNVTDYGMVARCAEIMDILKQRCGKDNVTLVVDNQNCYHCEQAWGIRFPAALEWIIEKPLSL